MTKSASGSSSASPSSGSSATKTRGSSENRVSVPETPGVARIIAIANQKGGVGKSTTAVSLGAALAQLGFRILVVDLDPQGNASTGIGIRHDDREVTSYDVIVAEAPVTDAIVHSAIRGLDAITSTIDLAGAEIELVSQFSREGRLKRALEPVRIGSYDFIFLDCPPSLGLITINALTAAEELIVPIQCEYYALEGLGQLLRNVSLVQQNINPELRLTGIVMTMFDPRTKLSEQVVDEVRRFFGDLVYDNIIPRTVRLSEAPGFGMPITVYDPKSKGAQSYRDLAREVASRPPPETPMPAFDDMPTISVPNLSAGAPRIAASDDVESAGGTPHVRDRGPTSDETAVEGTAPDESAMMDSPEAAEAMPVSSATAASEVPRPAVREAQDAVPTSAPTAPAQTAPVQTPPPAPTEPVPSEPASTEPASTEPAPTEPAPTEPASTEPASTEPASTEPAPPEPASTEPAPPEPAPAPVGPRTTSTGETDDEIWKAPRPDAKVRPAPRPVGGSPSERRVVVIDEDAELGGGPPQPTPGSSVNERTESIGATLHDDDGQRKRWRLFRKGGD